MFCCFSFWSYTPLLLSLLSLFVHVITIIDIKTFSIFVLWLCYSTESFVTHASYSYSIFMIVARFLHSTVVIVVITVGFLFFTTFLVVFLCHCHCRLSFMPLSFSLFCCHWLSFFATGFTFSLFLLLAFISTARLLILSSLLLLLKPTPQDWSRHLKTSCHCCFFHYHWQSQSLLCLLLWLLFMPSIFSLLSLLLLLFLFVSLL